MKIYTRTGDQGQTGLIGGARVAKASDRISAIGDIDELNAALGVARLYSSNSALDPMLQNIQNWLFDLGGEVASPDGIYVALTEAHVQKLEEDIDRLTSVLPPLKNFILPGGGPLGAHLHLVRTVCRRAERTVHTLEVRSEATAFLNRLSDWLFVAARTANAAENVKDVAWLRTEAV